jgi:hypothetical protein
MRVRDKDGSSFGLASARLGEEYMSEMIELTEVELALVSGGNPRGGDATATVAQVGIISQSVEQEGVLNFAVQFARVNNINFLGGNAFGGDAD